VNTLNVIAKGAEIKTAVIGALENLALARVPKSVIAYSRASLRGASAGERASQS
jgi:hypothetical protein